MDGGHQAAQGHGEGREEQLPALGDSHVHRAAGEQARAHGDEHRHHQAVDALGAGEQLQNESVAEALRLFGDQARGGFARDAYADGAAQDAAGCGDDGASRGQDETQICLDEFQHVVILLL